MQVLEWLDRLQADARRDGTLRQALLDTREAEDPMSEFCETCQRMGYPIYLMELIDAGEEFYAAMRRSTNGGGENSPKLHWEDDFYELFFATLS